VGYLVASAHGDAQCPICCKALLRPPTPPHVLIIHMHVYCTESRQSITPDLLDEPLRVANSRHSDPPIALHVPIQRGNESEGGDSEGTAPTSWSRLTFHCVLSQSITSDEKLYKSSEIASRADNCSMRGTPQNIHLGATLTACTRASSNLQNPVPARGSLLVNLSLIAQAGGDCILRGDAHQSERRRRNN
jgi:hypothetical protein